MNEQWKQIPGTDAAYEVSDMGRCRIAATGKILSPRAKGENRRLWVERLTKRNPLRVCLSGIVCDAFVGPRPDPDASVVIHIDNDTSNCEATNLRWGTRAEILTGRKNREYNGKGHSCEHCGDVGEVYPFSGKQCCGECYDELADGVVRNQNIHIIGNNAPMTAEDYNGGFENGVRAMEDNNNE